MLSSAIEGIQKRGGAQLGDKTLLDALIPIRDIVHEQRRQRMSTRATCCRQATQVAERRDRAHEAVGREARPPAVHRRSQQRHAGSGHRRDRDHDERHLHRVRRADAEHDALIATLQTKTSPGGLKMKKFVNDPGQIRAGNARRHRAREPRQAQVRAEVQPHLPRRPPEQRQGVGDPGLGQRPRARARHGGRPRHARRGLAGQRVRRAADGVLPRVHQAA